MDREYVTSMPAIANFPLGTKVVGPSTHRITKAEVYEHDLKLVLCDAWCCETDTEVMERQAAAASIWPQYSPRGIDSIGGLINRIIAKKVHKDHLKQLPPAFRFLPRDYHIGPMLVMSGGNCEDWNHYDINKAYLWSMMQPIPLRNTYRSTTKYSRIKKWLETRDVVNGFFKGTLYVEKEGLNIGPLPQRIRINFMVGGTEVFRVHTVWPTGYVTGEWPMFMVSNAVRKYGAKIVDIEDAYVCQVIGGVFDDYLGEIEKAKDVDYGLWKGLYQRAWTKFRPSTWIEGVKVERDRKIRVGVDYETVKQEVYKWRTPLIDWMSPLWPPGRRMRPDVTAYIAGRVAQRVVNAINDAGYGCVSFAHVDSLHVSTFGGISEKLGSNYGDFRKEKGPKPARFWSPGVYEYSQKSDMYNDRGEPEMPISEVVIHTRDWHSDHNGNILLPSDSEHATSDPLHHDGKVKSQKPLSSMKRNEPNDVHRHSRDEAFKGNGWIVDGYSIQFPRET